MNEQQHNDTHTHKMEYYLTIGKKRILAICNNMDLEGIRLSEINEREKDKYSMI